MLSFATNDETIMKVLLYDSTCAFLTPGGKTTHALKLQQEISKLGIDIQFARWWDESQKDFDIIHFLTTDPSIAKMAKERGKKCFVTQIFDFESNKSEKEKRRAMLKNKVIEMLPSRLSKSQYWKAYQYMDIVQFMHTYDRDTALRYFPKQLRNKEIMIIPHAYDPSEMNISDDLDIKEKGFPEKYLVSCANISTRKQTVLLAQYAKQAKVPVVFMGSKNESDPYWKAFRKEIDNKYVFYPGYVSKEWRDCIERNASGYVLLSQGESGCIAVYEAGAYKMPLLLSNLPWAWGYDSPTDIYFCDYEDSSKAISQLKAFYEISGSLEHTPFKIHTWGEVARIYVEAYKSLLK